MRTIKTSRGAEVMRAGQAMRETAERLGEHMSYVPFTDKPVIVAHSKDNHVTVVLSFRLMLKEWDDEAIERLTCFLGAMEREWRCDTCWHFTPVDLHALKSGFDAPPVYAGWLRAGSVASLPAVRQT